MTDPRQTQPAPRVPPTVPGGAQSFAQKALARAGGVAGTQVGQIVDARPDLALSHDNSAAIRTIWRRFGRDRVWDPGRMVITLDHAVPAPTTRHAQNHARDPPLRRGAGHRELLRRRHGHLSSGHLGGGSARSRPAHSRCRQPHTPLRLDGRFRRGCRALGDGRHLGDGRAVAAGPRVVADPDRRCAGHVGVGEGRGSRHHWAFRRRRRALPVHRDLGHGGLRDDPLEAG